MLEIMKMLLDLASDDTSKDKILSYYISLAQQIALSYCNTDSLPEQYDSAIAELAVYLYKNRDSIGISQKTEGERSVTYNVTGGIPDHIKAALPLPRVRVCGNV